MLACHRALRVSLFAVPALLLAAASPAFPAQTTDKGLTAASVTSHPECSYFTEAQRQKTMAMVGARSRLTEQVTRMRMATQSDSSSGTRSTAGFTPNGGNSSGAADIASMGTIDRNIFQA